MVFFRFTKFCFKSTALLKKDMNQQDAFTK